MKLNDSDKNISIVRDIIIGEEMKSIDKRLGSIKNQSDFKISELEKRVEALEFKLIEFKKAQKNIDTINKALNGMAESLKKF